MENNALEFLKTQINFNNNILSKNIERITNEEALVFPNGNVNSANWVLGSIIFVRHFLIKILGGDEVGNAEDFSFYKRGAKLLEDKNQFPDFETLKSYFKKSENELNRILSNKEVIPEENIGDLAALTLHEIYHCGQLGSLRKFLGKEGAIK